jgi:DNA polymerase/3'-5' exonuclease PolX
MQINDAYPIAIGLRNVLAPFCTNIEIAGSIRRQKPEVKDIEIVCMPKAVNVTVDLFGQPTAPSIPLYAKLQDLQAGGHLVKIKGKERYFQFQTPEGIALDLFCVLSPAQWGVVLAIRTGPYQFSQWLVTLRRYGGALPSNAVVHDAGVYVDNRLVEMPREADFLNYLGLGWISPPDRTPIWGRFPTRRTPTESGIAS